MTRTFRWPVFVALLAAFTLLAVPRAAAQPEVRARPTAPAPDKHYFGLRAVASVQRQLVFNLKALPPAEAITDVRLQLAALEKLFAKEGVDEEAVRILKDVQQLTEEYLKYARTIDTINEVTLEKLDQRLGLGERFVVALGSTAAGALLEPVSGSVIGFFVGFFLAEGYEEISRKRKAGKITDERWNQIQAAKSELESRMEADYVRHQKAVKKLAAKYGWKAGEAGLDATDDEVAGFHKSPATPSKAIDAAVLDERLKGLVAWQARRPRDPFTCLEHAALFGRRESLNKKDASADMRASATRLAETARACLAALDHIPPGERYDPYRIDLLLVVGDLANSAAALDALASGKGLFGSESRHASLAVKTWEECFRYCGKVDPNGFIRMRLAFAFAHDGQIEKGMALADEVAKPRRAERCPQFACNYARLKAMSGQEELAFGWLEYAVKSCGVDPSEFKDDPHLLPLKKAQPARFEAILTKRP